jgi:pyruvate dehydrogenase (quinone)
MTTENKPQFVQSRHEEMSAFEAVGFAKFSGTKDSDS